MNIEECECQEVLRGGDVFNDSIFRESLR